VGTAIEVAVRLDAVAYDLHAAVLAGGSQGVDSTLEAVEGMRVATGHTYLESLIVVISTDFALGHIYLLLIEAERFPILKVNTLDLAGRNARLEDARSLPLVTTR
jgi:hypothetical protein